MCGRPWARGARERLIPSDRRNGETSLAYPEQLGRELATVPVMEPADLRMGDHLAHLDWFNRPGIGTVAIQRAVCSRRVVVVSDTGSK